MAGELLKRALVGGYWLGAAGKSVRRELLAGGRQKELSPGGEKFRGQMRTDVLEWHGK